MIEQLKNKIVAHRGIHNNLNIPENSIEAFKKALMKKVPIELDVHILKDNTLVVFHDDNLKRMTGVDANIKDFTYNELEKLTLLDTDYKIPTLQEVLDLINGKVLVIIELKNDKRVNSLCTELVKILDNYNGEFIIQSFYPNIIKWFKKNKPNYIRGLLISDKYPNKLFKLLSKSNFILKYCSPNFLSVSKKILLSDKIQKLREKGLPVLTWTIKNDNDLKKVKGYTDGIISNIKYL